MFNKSIFKAAMLIFAANFLFNACTKPENELATTSAAPSSGIELMKVENGRIAFKNSDAFFKFTADITNKSDDELNFWEKQIGFNSLRSKLHSLYSDDQELGATFQKLEDFNFPKGHLSILNEKGECLIGDTIVVYLDGLKHFIPKKDEKMLEAIRSNPNISKIKGTATGKILPNATLGGQINLPENVTINAGGGMIALANYVYPFTSSLYRGNSSVGPKRFVHELVSWYETGNGVYFYARLFVRSKLEYPTNKSKTAWREAGEYRQINYNMSADYSVTFYDIIFGTPIIVSGNTSMINSGGSYTIDRWGHEALIRDINIGTSAPFVWTASVIGTIGQVMDGDITANYRQSGTSQTSPLW